PADVARSVQLAPKLSEALSVRRTAPNECTELRVTVYDFCPLRRCVLLGDLLEALDTYIDDVELETACPARHVDARGPAWPFTEWPRSSLGCVVVSQLCGAVRELWRTPILRHFTVGSIDDSIG